MAMEAAGYLIDALAFLFEPYVYVRAFFIHGFRRTPILRSRLL